MASVIKAGVVASAYVLGRGRHVLVVCASRRADINVSILFFVCIDANKSLQASVRALGVLAGMIKRCFASMIVPPADRLGFGLEIRLTFMTLYS